MIRDSRSYKCAGSDSTRFPAPVSHSRSHVRCLQKCYNTRASIQYRPVDFLDSAFSYELGIVEDDRGNIFTLRSSSVCSLFLAQLHSLHKTRCSNYFKYGLACERYAINFCEPSLIVVRQHFVYIDYDWPRMTQHGAAVISMVVISMLWCCLTRTSRKFNRFN